MTGEIRKWQNEHFPIELIYPTVVYSLNQSQNNQRTTILPDDIVIESAKDRLILKNTILSKAINYIK